MKKRSGIIIIVAMLAAAVFLSYTAVFGWGSSATGAAKNIHTGLDLSGGVSITYEADEAMPSSSDMDDTVYKMQRRVSQYSTEAQVYQEGANRITVEIPGVSDANAILQDLGSPGSLYFIAETDADGNENYSYSYLTGAYELNKTLEELEADGSIVCVGSDVAEATGEVMTDQSTNKTKYVVSLEFTKEGTEKFAVATQKAYNSGETIGIYYDESFISVPTVNAVISTGRAVIEGMESIEEARNLASFIRIGGLTLTLHEIRSNVVGAQLGQDALRTSLIGGAIGLAIVMLIMIVVYLVPGLIASVALIIYTALIFILLNAFDLTLTLPGIAGIILSIGMAVDANVIIYTRISEEIMAGTSVQGAIRSGFHKAMSAILDGNITTLIAAAVLGALGTGSIRGFALTLALGVALSLFTACLLSRLLVLGVYAAGVKDARFWSRKRKKTTFRFVEHRKIFFVIALCVILVGPVAMIAHKASGDHSLNFSMEFLGGTATTVEFNENYDLEELDAQVKPVVMNVTGDSDVAMQKVVNSNEVIIKTRQLSADERAELASGLSEQFSVPEEQITAESISATVGKEMRNSAILAVVIAVALMLLYIFIRFKDIRFATSAVLALIHDVLITLTAYAVLRITVGNSFIAVMLTILGYSINSTIVIFDRIREKLPTLRHGGDLTSLVNESINDTLTRSIYTNLTTFASILVLYIVGVSSIKDFVLPMMVGIVAGAFSSVCLTGSLWWVMKSRFGKNAVPAASASAGKSMEGNSSAEAGKEEAGKISSTGSNPNVIRKKKKKK